MGLALADSNRLRDNYTQIIRKADQINTLVTNLFTATLEELEQLSVTLTDMESGELAQKKRQFLPGNAAPKILDRNDQPAALSGYGKRNVRPCIFVRIGIYIIKHLL